MTEFFPEGILVSTDENKAALSSALTLAEAMHEGRILEAYASMCTSEHDLIVDLGAVKGIISRTEGAVGIKEGTVRDIALISRVNRPVCFIITGMHTAEDGTVTAQLSRRAAQERCIAQYIGKLRSGDIIDARITHTEKFGVFADIGCGLPSLLPIDMISVSRIDHPSQRFTVGDDIKVIVKSNSCGRICLTHKELLGTWEENASQFEIGQTVTGIVRSVESYGAFVELTPNLAGLAELKDGIEQGMKVSVYIKNIIPFKMKIKLIIIDTFENTAPTEKPKYFYDGDHIDSFLYSPQQCPRVIETVFS